MRAAAILGLGCSLKYLKPFQDDKTADKTIDWRIGMPSAADYAAGKRGRGARATRTSRGPRCSILLQCSRRWPGWRGRAPREPVAALAAGTRWVCDEPGSGHLPLCAVANENHDTKD